MASCPIAFKGGETSTLASHPALLYALKVRTETEEYRSQLAHLTAAMAITTMWLGSCTAVLAVVIAFFQLVTPYTNPPFDPPTDVGRIAGPSELRDRHLHIDRIITIEGRALDIADDTWNKLVGNGCRLLGLMSSTDADGAVYVAKQGSAESDFKESSTSSPQCGLNAHELARLCQMNENGADFE